MEKVSSEKASGQPKNQLGLEEIVRITNKVGLEYVEAKKRAEHLSLLRASTRAKIMIRLESEFSGERISEARLTRLAESDTEYVAYLECLAEAKRDADRLRVRYESYKNLFDARRSMLSYQKAEMALL